MEIVLDPIAAAKLAKLRHVSDQMPGITRHNARDGFDYRLPDGEFVRDIDTLKRIQSLVIPPAWTAVWICPYPNGHIQAVGREHGIVQQADINDRRLARIIKGCRDLPGYELFQYLDQEGNRQTIDSADVNDYLREISGEEITAKDFRTWAGTNLAALALQEFELFDTEAKKKRAVVRAVEKVAKHLRNTPAICRRCYIHPAIFDGYLDGTLLSTLKEETRKYLTENVAGMSAEEAAVAAFLSLRLGELEREQKGGTASRSADTRNNLSIVRNRAKSPELIHNSLN